MTKAQGLACEIGKQISRLCFAAQQHNRSARHTRKTGKM
jgi:hypothetical protein